MTTFRRIRPGRLTARGLRGLDLADYEARGFAFRDVSHSDNVIEVAEVVSICEDALSILEPDPSFDLEIEFEEFEIEDPKDVMNEVVELLRKANLRMAQLLLDRRTALILRKAINDPKLDVEEGSRKFIDEYISATIGLRRDTPLQVDQSGVARRANN
jgi:hypothetical protein